MASPLTSVHTWLVKTMEPPGERVQHPHTTLLRLKVAQSMDIYSTFSYCAPYNVFVVTFGHFQRQDTE